MKAFPFRKAEFRQRYVDVCVYGVIEPNYCMAFSQRRHTSSGEDIKILTSGRRLSQAIDVRHAVHTQLVHRVLNSSLNRASFFDR